MNSDSTYPNMQAWKINCVATVRNPSIVFWDWISLRMSSTTLRIYQLVLSLILTLLIQIIKKMHYVYGNNQHLGQKTRTSLPLYRRLLKPYPIYLAKRIVQSAV